ncbi:RHS repeat-associated core domain-containing protein [Streptomyces sp. NPDC005784]|uniref:RHS repeat-associated core domain-containing protein n=1 Tax=Streptomyces sp. NPDC005784 TaxID=3364731 RepID=UPI0036C2A2EE
MVGQGERNRNGFQERTRTITDVFGHTVEKRTYAGTDPADTAYGAGTGAAYTSVKSTYTLDNRPSTVTGTDGTQWTYGYDLFGRQTSSTDPDQGTTTTTYTNLDQTDTTTDARGKVLLYAYDVLGRKTDQWQTSKTDANKLAHWGYDTLAKGQLDDSISYVGGTTGSAYTQKVTAYDSLYHATGSQLTLPSTDPLVSKGALTSATLDFSSYYNIDGTQQYYKEPAVGGLSSEIVNSKYDDLGLITEVGGSTGYLLSADYNQLGQAHQYVLGTSEDSTAKKAYVTNTYEEGTDRLTRSLTTDATRAVQDLSTTYDDTGNVTSAFDTANLSGTGKTDYQCFTYDGYQRLTDAWTPSAASCATSGRTTTNLAGASPYWTSYAYTSSGLRKTETTHSGTGDSTRTYCYDSTHPHQLSATTTATSCTGVSPTYVYDFGNTTTRPNGTDTQSLTWSANGDLDTLTEKASSGTTKSTTSHVYNADGNLLIRRNTSGETVLYLGTTEVHLDTSTAKYWAQRYYSANGATIALRTNKTGIQALTYLSGDPHGTSTVSLDATTQAVTKRYLTPFGSSRTGGTGTWSDDKTFLGKTTDTTSGLTYVGAREYDSSIGRFISVDPILAPGDAQSLNGYTYADNSPVTESDPSGLCHPDECGVGVPRGNVVGGSSGIITTGPVDPGNSSAGSCRYGVCSKSTTKTLKSGGTKTTVTVFDLGDKPIFAQTIVKEPVVFHGYAMGTTPNYDPTVSDGWIKRSKLSTWQKVLLGIVTGVSTVVAAAPVAAALGPEAAAACLADPPACGEIIAEVATGGASGGSLVAGPPQGVTAEQFAEAAQTVRSGAGHLGDDIVVQGSRAAGTARADSDIDLAIRVSPERFDELVKERFQTPNPGSAKERTMLHAIETGKIQAGEAGLRGLRKTLEAKLGMEVDISVIRQGGPFDNPPFVKVP